MRSETRSEQLAGAAVKLVRNVPGLKQSVLSGVALLTRHETGYLQAKLKKQEGLNFELTKDCEELTSMLASVTKHVEREQRLNRDVKYEAAAVRRMTFVRNQHEQVRKHFPEYAKFLPAVEPLEKQLALAMSEKTMPVIVLTHIQKTAGNSVIAYLRRCLTPERVARIHEMEMATREETARCIEDKFGLYDVIAGHVPYSRRVDQLSARPAVNISVLREPVDRVASLYYYLKANASWLGQGQFLVENKVSIEDFAGCDAYFDNHMVRMLCDIEPAAVKRGECTQEMLEQAKVNIVRDFLLVGLTERSREFLAVFASLFCFSLEDVPIENVNEKRSPLSKVPQAAIDAIAHHNRFDVELYDFTKKLWDVTTDEWLKNHSF